MCLMHDSKILSHIKFYFEKGKRYMNWYALITTCGEEENICQIVNDELKLHAIYPRVERHFRTQGTNLLTVKPIVPGCIFIECDFDYAVLLDKLKNTSIEIQGLELISSRKMEVLKKMLSDECLIKMSKGIIQDQKKIIQEGSLVGLEAHIKKINRHKRLAVLDIDIHQKELLVGLEIVEKG